MLFQNEDERALPQLTFLAQMMAPMNSLLAEEVNVFNSSIGESKPAAAWTAIGNILLNVDEMITKG